MPLVFKRIETFTATVPVTLPGESREQRFTATFRHYNREALEGLVAEQMKDDELLQLVLVKVEGIGDEPGRELPPEQQIATVRGDVTLSTAAIRAFFDQLTGAAAKNSPRSRGR